MPGVTPPDNCEHHADSSDVPKDIMKYWQQRYDIFSKYDDDIWMTHDSWFGVTPEPIASTIAEHVAFSAPKSKTILIDAFAGVGGNTIAFALSGRWDQIFAIEQDAAALECAKHNAAVYGVANKIFWVKGDCFAEIKKRFSKGMQDKAVIFASPPWGGPQYSGDAIFDLTTMQPYSLQTLFDSLSKATREVVLYLPRTSDLNQLAQLVGTDDEELPDDKKLQVTHYCMHGASKALCAYYGNFTE